MAADQLQAQVQTLFEVKPTQDPNCYPLKEKLKHKIEVKKKKKRTINFNSSLLFTRDFFFCCEANLKICSKLSLKSSSASFVRCSFTFQFHFWQIRHPCR